jgi:hypothetical protein
MAAVTTARDGSKTEPQKLPLYVKVVAVLASLAALFVVFIASVYFIQMAVVINENTYGALPERVLFFLSVGATAVRGTIRYVVAPFRD